MIRSFSASFSVSSLACLACLAFSSLEKERGKKGTMLLYVQYRQRSTWQGMVKWVEGDQEWKFFSELELFKIINQAIQ